MIILSTIATGWLYFVDALGGSILAVISLALAKRTVPSAWLSAHSVIELSVSAVRASTTEPGDELEFSPAGSPDEFVNPASKVKPE